MPLPTTPPAYPSTVDPPPRRTPPLPHLPTRYETTSLLLQGGANPSLQNTHNKRTPLHLATTFGHFSTVIMLLKHGAALLKRDSDGRLSRDVAREFKETAKDEKRRALFSGIEVVLANWGYIESELRTKEFKNACKAKPHTYSCMTTHAVCSARHHKKERVASTRLRRLPPPSIL